MSEIFEIDEIPQAAASGNSDSAKEKIIANDKHLPNFDFDNYPNIEEELDSSPRIVDETWQRFEKQSVDEIGATNLRHDPQLLDKLI